MGAVKIATIRCTINVTGKTLVPDEDGFYYVNLGALNVENTSGIFYKADTSVLDLFSNPRSLVNKRIAGKKLFGEYKHPVITPELKAELDRGNSKPWLLRNIELDDDRFALQIREIDLIETDVVDRVTGLKKILIKGWVKPHGPYGYVVKESLEGKHTSASFSIRVIMRDDQANGRVERTILIVSTWDFVSSPGIEGSTDQHSVATELDISDIAALEEALDAGEIVATESDLELIRGATVSLRKGFETEIRGKLLKGW
jgi:hypothetical protein